MVLASVFASATAPCAPLQRQPSGALMPQGSLTRQPSGPLLRQGSGSLQPTRSGSLAAAVTRRPARTSSVACAAAAGDADALAGAEPLRPQGSLPPQQPLAGGGDAQAAQQAHEQQPEVADLDALMASSVEGISTDQFDSYALRHLVQSPPAATAHLSSLAITPRRVLRRYAVRSVSGERCVMTLTFEHRSGAAPGAAAAGPPHAPAAGGWVLAGATGEPAAAEPPAGPAPEHPPEAVVAAVLTALRSVDPFSAWRFMSVAARPALGGSAERFGAALDGPELRPLLLHASAEPALRRQRSGDRYSEIVRLETVTGDCVSYCFTVGLQCDGPFEDCWMVESIRLVGGDGCASAGDCGAGGACAVPEHLWGGDF